MPQLTVEDCQTFLVAELKDQLKARNAPTNGKKAELLQRLIDLVTLEIQSQSTIQNQNPQISLLTAELPKPDSTTSKIGDNSKTSVQQEFIADSIEPTMIENMDISPQLTVEDCQTFLVAELKDQLKARNAPTNGKKAELLQRLIDLVTLEIQSQKKTPPILNATSASPPEEPGHLLYTSKNDSMTRFASLALLTDPNLVLLLRLSRVFFARCDVLQFLGEEIQSIVEQVYSQLLNSGTGRLVEKDEIISTCYSLGLKFVGRGFQFPMESNNDADTFLKAFISSQEKSTIVKGFSYWNTLKKVFSVNIWSETVQLRMSFICMRCLLESGRAFVSDHCSDNSLVINICSRLDTNTFRHVMSYLGEKADKKKERTGVLFSSGDVTDNFSSELCHGSIAEAVAEGVEEIHQVRDMHTDTSFLHVQAARGHTDDVKALLAMGMDPSIVNGSSWENGDGWGELEFLSFTPLHFAAANGRVDVAKVLLEHGAKVKLNSGWDGGSAIPLTKPGGEYWYTSSSTPLHLAARGNHAEIIHLILGGPSPAAVLAAAQRGFDLHDSWSIVVDVTGPTEDFESDDGKKTETLSLTPLAVALMFGNLAAAKALLQHGASFDKIGFIGGYARERILDGLMVRSSGKCRPFILERLPLLDAAHNEDISKFKKKFGDVDGKGKSGEENSDGEEDSNEKEDEEDAWLRDDWDDMAVASGDALVEENEETGMRIVADGLQYAAAIAFLLAQLHPAHCLSRNAQHMTDGMAHVIFKDLVQIFTTGNLTLSPDNVEACITAYLKEGPLLEMGLKEAKKESGEALFLDQVTSALQQEGLPVIEDEKAHQKAIIMIAKFMEYLLAEVFELSGNCAREKHLQVVWPAHIYAAISADEELQRIFQDFVFLDAIPQNRPSADRERYMKAYTKENFLVKVDEFEQQGVQVHVHGSSPLSALQLARMEVDFFTANIQTGPVMSRSYFKQFWARCGDSTTSSLDISDEAAVILQLVTEHRVRRILEKARDAANERITNMIQTEKALKPFRVTESLSGEEEEEEEEHDEEGEEEGKEDGSGHGTQEIASCIAALFSSRWDLCYADLKSVQV